MTAAGQHTLTILGGAREIGANSSYLHLGADRGLLLDAGLHPKRQGRDALPPFASVAGDVDAILVSHAHLDHVGALPIALRQFPRARVYTTAPTSLLAVRMLRNAVAVARSRALASSAIVYADDQVEWVEQVLHTQEEGKSFSLEPISGEAPRVTFFRAGHLLGAVGILVEHHGRRFFYSGDTCASSQHVCDAALYPRGGVDVLLLESTHGADRAVDLEADRSGFDRAQAELAEFICTVAGRGGAVLIPVFALGRSQEILGVLAALVRQGKLPALPIYISGLAHAINRIYDATRLDSARRNRELRLEDIGYRLLDPERWQDESLLQRPCILAATSGMMYARTTSHFLASRMLPVAKHGIAFVGFLDPDSPGHRVAQAPPGDTVDLGVDGGPVRVACSVRRFAFTAHSRASQLLATVEQLRPRRVVLVHGDSEATEALARHLASRSVATTIAEPGMTVEL